MKSNEVEIQCPGLPAALDGYRIVQVADIHVSAAAPRWRTEAIVALANAADADLAVCTGDIVDGTVHRRRRDVEPLKELKARDGVWFVTGNHEFYGDWDEWSALFDKWGIRFLRNECVFPREGLALGGVDDDAIFRWRAQATAPDVGQAFASATNGEFRVLLQHKPKEARANVFSGVRLQLSGHTHGGVMPLLNILVYNANDGFVRIRPRRVQDIRGRRGLGAGGPSLRLARMRTVGGLSGPILRRPRDIRPRSPLRPVGAVDFGIIWRSSPIAETDA